jgi:hypothetical protein
MHESSIDSYILNNANIFGVQRKRNWKQKNIKVPGRKYVVLKSHKDKHAAKDERYTCIQLTDNS